MCVIVLSSGLARNKNYNKIWKWRVFEKLIINFHLNKRNYVLLFCSCFFDQSRKILC